MTFLFRPQKGISLAIHLGAPGGRRACESANDRDREAGNPDIINEGKSPCRTSNHPNCWLDTLDLSLIHFDSSNI